VCVGVVCVCVCVRHAWLCRLYLPYSEDSSSGGINFLFGIVNAIVFVALVLVMTVILVLLFKYRCDKVRTRGGAARKRGGAARKRGAAWMNMALEKFGLLGECF